MFVGFNNLKDVEKIGFFIVDYMRKLVSDDLVCGICGISFIVLVFLELEDDCV